MLRHRLPFLLRFPPLLILLYQIAVAGKWFLSTGRTLPRIGDLFPFLIVMMFHTFFLLPLPL